MHLITRVDGSGGACSSVPARPAVTIKGLMIHYELRHNVSRCDLLLRSILPETELNERFIRRRDDPMSPGLFSKI